MNFAFSVKDEYIAIMAMLTLSFATCNQVAIDDPVPAPVYVVPDDPFALLCAATERSDSLAAVFDSTVKEVRHSRHVKHIADDTTVQNPIIRISPHFGENNRKK